MQSQENRIVRALHRPANGGTAARRGMTLLELLIGTALVVGGGGALLMGMHYAMAHAEYLRQVQIAMNAAQGRIEQLTSFSFDTLWEDNAPASVGIAYAGARTSQQSETLTGVPSGTLVIQIRPVPLTNLTPTLLDLHVAACWRHRGRAIGGDLDQNGACVDGNDADSWVNSPVMVTTRVARRD